MDTYMNVRVYSDDETLLDDSESRITQLESLFAVNVEGSDLWNVNHANGETTTVSDDTAQTLSTALEVCKATNGALDVSIYPLLKAWGFTTGEYSVPTQETIDSLLANVDYSQVVLNGNEVTIPQNYEIDFGAVAKGYTSDSLIENFRANGVQSAIVNLGGNVQTLGTKPDGSLWNVAITNPFSPSEELGILSIESKAVITSGNYERYFTDDDGNRYWHILDTSTGYPADNGLVSVTIVGDSGTMCDALSTALYVLGTDKAIQYWESNPNFGMVLVTDDKSIYITQDLTDTFQNLTDYNLEVLNYE
jgi:thiamine biosynthesis lipoprotein